MFGRYTNYVLALTVLAGVAYSLPQVKNEMVGAFDISGISSALVFNFSNQNSSNTKAFRSDDIKSRVNNIARPVPESARPSIDNLRPMGVKPEEIVILLAKENLISKDNIPKAIKVLKDYAERNRIQAINMNSASSTREKGMPIRPFATSTRPYATSTRPIDERVFDDRIDNNFQLNKQIEAVE